MRFFRYLCTILVAFIFISSCEDKKHHAFGNLNLQFEYNPTVTLSENKEPSNLKNNPTQSHLSNPIEKTIDFNKDVIIEMKDQDFKLSSEKISSVILQDYSTARITINNGNPVSLNLATTTSYNRTLSVGAAQIKIELLSSGSVVLYESTKSVQVYEDQSTSVIFKSSDWTVQNQEISITDGGFGDEVNVGQSITFQWTNSHAARPVRVYLIQGNENNQIQTLNSSYIGSSYTHNTTGSSAANNLGFKVTSSINSEVSSSVCCFNLKAPNVAPTAKNISAETNEDSPKEIQFDGEDSNGDSLTYSILSQPSNGSLGSISNDKVIYTPGQDFYGTDTFTYQASDGTYNSNAATVTITIAPINDPPVVQNIETSIDENLYQEGRYAEISLLGSDVDGDNLTYKLESNPSNGNASISGNLLTYNANQDWNGTESFSYSANDGQDDSNVSSIVIHVNAVNDAPVTIDATAETDEDTAVEITLTGTDIDVGDQLNFSTVQSNNGTISYNGNIATYTPTANFNGTDTFTFKANDGTDDSNTSTVTITVASVNDAPVANDVTASMNENKIAGRYQPVTITLDATDVEGDDLTYSIVGTPSNGTLGSISDNQIIYTPSQDYNGEDTFTYKANDGTADSNTATVTVTINAVNDAPVTTDQTASTDEDTAVEITLAATDVENDNLTFTIVSDVSNG
ncbi:MAG: Ig-like domain-containing protein, partial [Betaproteobacteria bacterium]